jgi:hypothetical protein
MENLAGVCKDCGSGTMNNELSPVFEMLCSDGLEECELRCIACGSTHVDVLTF